VDKTTPTDTPSTFSAGATDAPIFFYASSPRRLRLAIEYSGGNSSANLYYDSFVYPIRLETPTIVVPENLNFLLPCDAGPSLGAALALPKERCAQCWRVAASLALLILPFTITFNEFLTAMVDRLGLYWVLERWIVPTEACLVSLLLQPTGLGLVASPSTLTLSGAGLTAVIEINWNCAGWQSFLLLVSLVSGLRGSYHYWSRVECILLGVTGILVLNLMRIAGVALIAFYLKRVPAVIFHDYGGTTVVTVVWLFAFWYFCLHYVLEAERG